MSGLRGLRTINYRTERRTDALAVRADDRRGRRSLESTNRKSYMARRRGYTCTGVLFSGTGRRRPGETEVRGDGAGTEDVHRDRPLERRL